MKSRFYKIIIFIIVPFHLLPNPFSDNGDGSVIDQGTGLIWQKCSVGQTADTTCSGTAIATTWSLALIQCKNLSLGSRIWRLPNVNEMVTLINPLYPYIDKTIFPSTVSDKYWTSTGTNTSARIINFKLDFSASSFLISGSNKAYSAYVRCVSGP